MKLSIIISNRNDTVMLAITVRSCIEALKFLPSQDSEIVIVDNSDPEPKALLKSVLPGGYIQSKKIKLFHQDFPCLFTARELAIKKSTGEYILCIDSHMLIGHNMMENLVAFMDRKKQDKTLGFAHAPINWAHQHERAAKHDRDMSVNELGNWNRAYEKERTITWKGMPWICRREWFLDQDKGLNGYGSLSRHRLSWGGGDMHIGIKPWLLGFKNWAVPCAPGIHIGPFPKIDIGDDKNSTKVGAGKYRLYGNSGVGPHGIGFLVSCYVLGGISMMERNKAAITERFGRYIDVDKHWAKAIHYGQEERQWINEKKVMGFNKLLEIKPWDI